MKQTILNTLTLSLSDIKNIISTHMNLPDKAKFKFETSLKKDPKADVRDPSYLTVIKSLKVEWKERQKTTSMKIPLAEVSQIILSSQKREGSKIEYTTKEVKDTKADIRDPNWITVVSGVKITSKTD